jgi:hypothetical protein
VNVQQQIAKLESLLGRIQRNAGKARASVGVAPAAKAAFPAEEAPHSALPPTARADLPTPAPPAPITLPPAPITSPPAAIHESVAEVSVETSTVDLEEIDMMDEEIVELGGEASATVVGGDDSLEADFGDMDEVPESAPRPAALGMPEPADLEPPVKTPPPESGRQFVSVAAAQPVDFSAQEADIDASDVDDLLEPDRAHHAISKAPPSGPAVEQLGDTVELEGADAPDADLDLEPVSTASPMEALPDDLELSLPQQGFSGGYDQGLAAPPGARADLDRHLRDQGHHVEPLQMDTPAPPAPAAGPVVVARPASDIVHVADMVAAKPAKMPATFLELLDASLALTARR